MTEPILERTLELLRASTLSRTEIARRAKVGSEWLKKLEAGDIPNPGVVGIQKLHDFLSSVQSAQAA